MPTSVIPSQQKWIDAKVANGTFTSADEVVFEALRLFREITDDPKMSHEVLRLQIQRGINDANAGRAKPLDIEDIKRRGRERLAENHHPQ